MRIFVKQCRALLATVFMLMLVHSQNLSDASIKDIMRLHMIYYHINDAQPFLRRIGAHK
jgi:hypothetical protein